MALSPGDKLGPYDVVALLGKGGMGEVYRAHDAKLNRDVAIKVLPAALANDADYLARFQREAQSLAALQHPNIATIYGLEQNAIIMELVDGHPLQGPLPLKQALAIARQIAEALEAAHDRGIIHRDLKPGNILVTSDGTVKILDFGLAKAVNERSTQYGADSPTLTLRATEAGLILGTAGYMSPEQAAGKPVDRRADIWSFGVVLHELITGKRLFDGETVSHTLAHVLTRDLDCTGIPAGPVRELVRRCLDRNIKNRLSYITEARIAIDNMGAAPAASPQSTPNRWPWAVAAVLLAALGALGWLHYRATPQELLPSRASLLVRTDLALNFTNGLGLPAVSPDGRRIVFGARKADGKTPLWVRPLDGLTAQPLDGTESATFPFWSPDSRFIAFFADGKLKKIDAAGGPVMTLADAPTGRGGSWNPQGVIVFGALARDVGVGSGIYRVSASGGKSTPLAAGRLPFFLPGGTHFLQQGADSGATGQVTICAGSLDSGTCKEILKANSNAMYAQGHILFIREGTLMAQPFDAKAFAVTGDAVPIAERVQAVLNSETAGVFSVSNNGVLVFREGGKSDGGSVLTWLNRAGKEEGTVGDSADFTDHFALSPDGKRLAAGIRSGKQTDIWTIDLARGLRTRLTFDEANDANPVWSPDGRTIAFRSDRKGHMDLYRKLANGVGAEELLFADDRNKSPGSWSPDGKVLLFFPRPLNSTADEERSGLLRLSTWALPLTPERTGQPLKPVSVLESSRVSHGGAHFSPDGRWISYSGSSRGEPNVYVTAYPPGTGAKWQISPNRGRESRWRQDGKEIFFQRDDRLFAAEVAANGAEFHVGQVRELFAVPGARPGFRYEPSADGQHFLVDIRPQSPAADALTLVQNWAAALKP